MIVYSTDDPLTLCTQPKVLKVKLKSTPSLTMTTQAKFNTSDANSDSW